MLPSLTLSGSSSGFHGGGFPDSGIHMGVHCGMPRTIFAVRRQTFMERYRLSVFNQVLKGSAFIGQHKVQLANGAAHESQELILPFAEIAVDGSGQALIVNDFVRPEYSIRAELPDGKLALTEGDKFYPL